MSDDRLTPVRWLHVGLVAETTASQVLEFAVTLPLLVVFVVGIFDFGNAFNLKQKLNNAVREGARFASSLPTNDLSSSTGSCQAPTSVCAIRDLVDSYLKASKVNDCGGVQYSGRYLQRARVQAAKVGTDVDRSERLLSHAEAIAIQVAHGWRVFRTASCL